VKRECNSCENTMSVTAADALLCGRASEYVCRILLKPVQKTAMENSQNVIPFCA